MSKQDYRTLTRSQIHFSTDENMSSGENRGRGSNRSRSRSPFDRRNNATSSSPHRKANVTSAPRNLSPISSSGASSEGIPSPELSPINPASPVIATQTLDLPTITPRANDRPSQSSSPVQAPTQATVGIMSMGDMGTGIAKMLIAHNYRVFTNLQGRSRATRARAKDAKITNFDSVERLVSECDYILSIVPPSDAYSNARSIALALQGMRQSRTTPLVFLELNAISPRTAKTIADLFRGLPAIFIDGGIIGGPPRIKSKPKDDDDAPPEWVKPNISLSGPKQLIYAPMSGPHLAAVLNSRHISNEIGKASGLKMCFAATTKGFSAILIQSFTTASSLGLLEDLKKEMRDMNPQALVGAERSLPSIPPKAYRWVREMQEIADTFSEEGGFEEQVFLGVAQVYKTMAEDTVLGDERFGDRERGTTLDDLAEAMKEGLYITQRDGAVDDGNDPGKNHIEG